MIRNSLLVSSLFVLTSILSAQAPNVLDLSDYKATTPWKRGPRPGHCKEGEVYYDTGDRKLMQCTATDTWTDFLPPLGASSPAGSAGQMQYNGTTVNLGSGLIWNNAYIGPTVYYSTGAPALNDCTFGGSYNDTTNPSQGFFAFISTTGTPDKFRWLKYGGTESAEIPITGAAQAIANGITFTCTATTGHTQADEWDTATGRVELRGSGVLYISSDASGGLGIGGVNKVGSNAVAIHSASATGDGSIAIGVLPTAEGLHSIAIGTTAQSFAAYAMTLGYRTRATATGAVTIGSGGAGDLINSTANSICFGTNTDTCQALLTASGFSFPGTLETTNFPALTGDVSNSAGSLSTTVGAVNGVSFSALGTGLLLNTTGTGAPSIAVAGVDYVVPSGNVATSTALEANGSNCPAGQYPLGVDASGAVEDCTPSGGADPLGSYIVQTGTNAPANAQILASLQTGIVKATTSTGVLSIAVGSDIPPVGDGGQIPYNGTTEYLPSGIIWDNTYVGPVAYVPIGATALNDCSFAGAYTDGTAPGRGFVAYITTVGTPDKFRWFRTGAGGPGLSAEVSITGAAQALTDGVTVTCSATTGHTLTDRWFSGTGKIISNASGTLDLHRESYGGLGIGDSPSFGQDALAIGFTATASGQKSIAIGYAPTATVDFAIAIGVNVLSTELGSVTIGSGTTVGSFLINNTANSLCFGANSTTCQALISANGLDIEALKTTGAATGKSVVCVDTTTGRLYASSTGTDCSD